MSKEPSPVLMIIGLCTRSCWAVVWCLVFFAGTYTSEAFAKTYHFNSKNTSPYGWALSPSDGMESEMYSVIDEKSDFRVINLKGRVTVNFNDTIGPHLKDDSYDSPTNKDKTKISWTFKTTERFRFIFTVSTSAGIRTLIYTDSPESNPVKADHTSVFGLGPLSSSGKWVKVARDLAKDIRRVEPGVAIRNVLRVTIAGQGQLNELLVERAGAASAEKQRQPIAQKQFPTPLSSKKQTVDIASAALTSTNALSSVNGLIVDPIPNSTALLREPENSTEKSIVPNVQLDRWSLNTYLVAARNTYTRTGDLENELNYAGLSGKYANGDKLNVLVDLFPDYALVELKLDDLDLGNTDERQEDPREFFKDGLSYFGDDSEYFYSLSVPDFIYGIKGYTTLGSSKAGALFVESNDGRKDAHVRYTYGEPGRNAIALESVASSQDEHEHRLLGLSLENSFKYDTSYKLTAAVVQDTLTEDESSGRSGSLELTWSPGPFSFGYKADYYDRGFIPVNALVNQNLPGTRGSSVSGSFYHTGAGRVREVIADATFSNRESLAGQETNDGLYASAGAELFKNTRLNFEYTNFRYQPVATESDNLLSSVNPDEYWGVETDFNIQSSFIGYGFSFADGELSGGEYQYLSLYTWFFPIQNLSIELFNESLTSFGEFSQNSIKFDWTVNPRQSLIGKYSSGDNYEQWRLAYRHRFSKKHEIFIAYQKLTETDDEVLAKYSWRIK